MPQYDKFFREVEKNEAKFVERLRDAVAIASISAEAHRRPDVLKMVNWTKKHLERLGAHVELCPIGEETLPNGSKINLPPIIFGKLGNDANKKTLLVYGHLDVQPAAKQDGWLTEPFELTKKNGKLFGRGSTDDKGPVIGWINAIETLQKNKIPIPVNIKFCLEAMEESGSIGLEDALKKKKDSFLSDVNFTCISDSYWLGNSKPCISYGLRGVCYYYIEVTGIKQDLHSGVYGGSIFEPMADVIWLMSQLTSVEGHINIDGLNDLVAPVTDDERKLYQTLDFDLEEYRQDVGAVKLISNSKEEILMKRWRYPSLSLHGIEGAFSGEGAKTVIPCKVIGKFSIRIVPHMKPSKVDELVVKHLKQLWEQRKSPNHFRIEPHHSGNYWLSDFNHKHYQCAVNAVTRVFGVSPDFIREGGSIPITLTFEELTGNNVLLLPIGASDDMAHSQNEKINLKNYIEGTKLLGAYLLELENI